MTNQKSSGRCWLFAALNLFREIANKRLNMEQFELSQNYIAYWDKLEKANYFLDSIMRLCRFRPETDESARNGNESPAGRQKISP